MEHTINQRFPSVTQIAEIDSASGAVSLQAGKDITLEAGRKLTDERLIVRTEQDGLFSSSSTLKHDESQSDRSVSTNVTGKEVQLVAGQDILVSGSSSMHSSSIRRIRRKACVCAARGPPGMMMNVCAY